MCGGVKPYAGYPSMCCWMKPSAFIIALILFIMPPSALATATTSIPRACHCPFIQTLLLLSQTLQSTKRGKMLSIQSALVQLFRQDWHDVSLRLPFLAAPCSQLTSHGRSHSPQRRVSFRIVAAVTTARCPGGLSLRLVQVVPLTSWTSCYDRWYNAALGAGRCSRRRQTGGQLEAYLTGRGGGLCVMMVPDTLPRDQRQCALDGYDLSHPYHNKLSKFAATRGDLVARWWFLSLGRCVTPSHKTPQLPLSRV